MRLYVQPENNSNLGSSVVRFDIDEKIDDDIDPKTVCHNNCFEKCYDYEDSKQNSYCYENCKKKCGFI